MPKSKLFTRSNQNESQEIRQSLKNMLLNRDYSLYMNKTVFAYVTLHELIPGKTQGIWGSSITAHCQAILL